MDGLLRLVGSEEEGWDREVIRFVRKARVVGSVIVLWSGCVGVVWSVVGLVWKL